jgi:hypothetical protein
LVVGLFLGNDYGVTFDEERNATKGAAALRTYAGSREYFQLDALPDHGPIYFMFFNVTARIIHSLAPSWPEADGRHFTNFLMFLLAVWCFYRLCLRFVGCQPAWMATILFATQPLLFGNGFINQKDTPFMALFLAALVAGLAAADRLWARDQPAAGAFLPALLSELREVPVAVWDGWKRLSRGARSGLLALLLLAVLLALDLLWIGTLKGLGEAVLANLYRGSGPAPLQRLFEAIATDAYKTPLDVYLDKLGEVYDRIRLPLLLLLLPIMLILASRFLPRLGQAWGFSRRLAAEPMLWLAAFLLGATVNVRQLGVFVGGLVSLYLLYRNRLKAGFPLLLYWGAGGAVTYATWPYLWPDPIRRFVDSLFFAAQFPPHRTFFEGRWMSSRILPWYYFPKLVALQLTEPAVLLLVAGAGVALWRLRRDRTNWFLYALLALWVGVPLVGLVFFDMTIYGNLRHVLFTMPALALVGGIGLDAVLLRVRRPWAKGLALAAAVLPGVWALIGLHPYEYIYMNSLAGGVSGAYGQYELDRQCISLREGIEQANQITPPGAIVLVLRQISSVVPYARPDLRLIDDREPLRSGEYILSCYWPSATDLGPEGFEPIYEVRVGKAVLTDLWRRLPEVGTEVAP